MSNDKAQAQSSLPLSVPFFYILLALQDADRHGYAIISEVAKRTDGAVRLRTGTLYNAVRRMLAQGLIEEVAERPDPAIDDERRRYYRATDAGRRVFRAEATRLRQMLSHAEKQAVMAGAVGHEPTR